MGGTEYGIYVFVWTWVLVLGAMSHLGLNLASIRLAPVYRETADFDHLRGLIRGVRLVALGGGTAVMALGLFGVWTTSKVISSCRFISLSFASAGTDVQDGIGRDRASRSFHLMCSRPVVLLAAMFAQCDRPADERGDGRRRGNRCDMVQRQQML